MKSTTTLPFPALGTVQNLSRWIVSQYMDLERLVPLLQLSSVPVAGWPYQWAISDFLLTLLTCMETSIWTASFQRLLKFQPMCWPGCCCSTCPGDIPSLPPSSWVAVYFSSCSWCPQVWMVFICRPAFFHVSLALNQAVYQKNAVRPITYMPYVCIAVLKIKR